MSYVYGVEHLVRKDMGVNGHERQFNTAIRHKFK